MKCSEDELTDIEILTACAKALGVDVTPGGYAANVVHKGPPCLWVTGTMINYDPLHNDDQAMALVKKFKLFQEWREACESDFGCDFWHVSYAEESPMPIRDGCSAENPDLNRAICECVAHLGNPAKHRREGP
jgi:hypothetical protein